VFLRVFEGVQSIQHLLSGFTFITGDKTLAQALVKEMMTLDVTDLETCF